MKKYLALILALSVLACMADSCSAANAMPLGVDDSGRPKDMYEPNAGDMREAFEEIGFDFLVHDFYGELNVDRIGAFEEWAKTTGHSYLFNQGCTKGKQGAEGVYQKPGFFFQPSSDVVKAILASPHCMGICYDEPEHWVTNGADVLRANCEGRTNVFVPHLYNAEGDTLEQAYQGNVDNLQAMMKTNYPGFQKLGFPRITSEHVFPIMLHSFARAGITPTIKLLKESMTPVAAAMAMGAAKEYGLEYWVTTDLWYIYDYPGHSPEELKSALLFAYWTGADRCCIENFNYRDSLYKAVDGKAVLSAYGEVAKQFKKTYVPGNPRAIRFQGFSPETIIVRFEDTDWGQEIFPNVIIKNLYGATNLVPDEQTRYWEKIWNVISHGTIPVASLNWNGTVPIKYRFFIPANDVAVYDHLASDPKLYSAARLIFLTGKLVSKECMATLEDLAKSNNITVVSPSHLAPSGMPLKNAVLNEYKVGRGRWIITNDVTNLAVRTLLRPYLGKPDELRYVFGGREVVFTAPTNPAEVSVTVKQGGRKQE